MLAGYGVESGQQFLQIEVPLAWPGILTGAILAFAHTLGEFGVVLMVGGNLDPNELESLLEYELETHHKEAAEPAHAVQKVADADLV